MSTGRPLRPVGRQERGAVSQEHARGIRRGRSPLHVLVGLGVLVLLALGGLACRSPLIPLPTGKVASPTVESVPSPSAVPTVPPSPRSQNDVLAACPPAEQAQAMRSDYLPAWETLPLWACYDLDLELQEEGRAYAGRARITVLNRTGSPLDELVLRLYPNAPVIYGGKVSLEAVTVDGQPVEPEIFLSDGTAVRLPLPEPLPPEASARVVARFRGQVPTDFGSDEVYGIFNRTSDGPVVTLANWYPLLAAWADGKWYAEPVIGEGDAVVSEVGLYRVRVAVPAGWSLVATGSIVEQRQADGYTFYEMVSGPVREFTVVASPAYTPREERVGGVRLVHWGLEAGETAWDEALDVARGSVSVFEERFGPYPYAELEVAAIPMRNAAGVEYPGLALIGAELYTSDRGRSFLPVAVAHEVAHQWWYGVVGNDVIRAPWQDEALTTYSSLLYFEAERPATFARLIKAYEREVEKFEEEADISTAIAQPLRAFKGRSEAYGIVVYLKGALFFHELRQRLGDDLFFQALRAYYARYQYRIAPAEALLDIFEEACGCSLDEVYREWGVK